MSSPVRPADVEWRIVLARRFLDRAEEATARAGRIAATEAVIAAQDGIELLIGAVAASAGKTPANERSFPSLLDAAAEASRGVKGLKTRLLALNNARVGAKHHGTAPDARIARDLVRDARTAARAMCRDSPINLDFESASVFSAYRHLWLGRSISEAASLLESWKPESTQAFSESLALALWLATRAASVEIRVSPFRGGRIRDRLSRSGDSLGRDVRDAVDAIDQELEKLSERIERLEAGVAPDDWDLWNLLPSVQLLGNGKVRYGGGTRTLPEHEARRAFASVLGYAERADQAGARELASREGMMLATEPVQLTHAVGGDGEVVCELLPGDRVRRVQAPPGEGKKTVLVRAFGLTCRAPASAFEEDPDAPGSHYGLVVSEAGDR